MYRRLGYYPTETSEHSSEYVPWYLHDDAEIERLRLPIRDYVGISAANVEETERLIAEASTGEYVEPEEDAAEYAPQVIHSMVTGQRREIQANVVNHGLIDNLPAGRAGRGAVRDRRRRRAPQPVGDLPSQCAALNRAFLSVVDLTVRAATELRPEHIRHALMVDPNTVGHPRRGAIWATGGRDGRGARAPAAERAQSSARCTLRPARSSSATSAVLGLGVGDEVGDRS